MMQIQLKEFLLTVLFFTIAIIVVLTAVIALIAFFSWLGTFSFLLIVMVLSILITSMAWLSDFKRNPFSMLFGNK